MSSAIKINQLYQTIEQDTTKGDPSALLFLVASIIRFQNKLDRQRLLEIDGFNERYNFLVKQLANETERIADLVKRADGYNKMDREERREAIMNMFKKINNNSNNMPTFPDNRKRGNSMYDNK